MKEVRPFLQLRPLLVHTPVGHRCVYRQGQGQPQLGVAVEVRSEGKQGSGEREEERGGRERREQDGGDGQVEEPESLVAHGLEVCVYGSVCGGVR